MSSGRTRSLHGTQGGASTAESPGRSRTSSTVTVLARGARASVTVHVQPRYPGTSAAKRWATSAVALGADPEVVADGVPAGVRRGGSGHLDGGRQGRVRAHGAGARRARGSGGLGHDVPL